MKKLAIIIMMILCVTCVFTACNFTQTTYTIQSEKSSYTVTIGEQVDLTSYFTITSATGENIPVTSDMIDAPNADFTKAGVFIVVCSYQGVSKSIIVRVEEPHSHVFEDATCTEPKTCSCGATEGEALGHTEPNIYGKCERCGTQLEDVGQTLPLFEILATYQDYNAWNFCLSYDLDSDKDDIDAKYAYTYIYYYEGENFYYRDAQNDFVDYVVYGQEDTLYYLDNLDGTYTKISYNDDFDTFAHYFSYVDWVDLAKLSGNSFNKNGDHYSAVDAAKTGADVLGELIDCVFVQFDLYISNNQISKIVAVEQDNNLNATFTYTIEITQYNTIIVDVSNLVLTDETPTHKCESVCQTCGGCLDENCTERVCEQKCNCNQGGTVTPPSGNVMPEQTFDPNNHINNDDILYDAVTDYEEKQNVLPSTGLLSQGTYNVLVVPVEFSDDRFINQELTDLGNAFNNQSAPGWESVNSYYKTSSYGKLDITFDIADKVTLNYTYSHFDGGSDHGENILKLALDELDASGFDFSKYDYDSNGVVDGVYIIYSAPIDYYSNDSYYWAYVNWAQNELVYDNLDVYTYLFASVDFMYEDVETSGSDYAIDGLVLNASTYIHETGHMLGLDDYYDYAPNTGSDKGLGCADMMDYTVGDHNAYSKLMLGWVNPTVVTQTQTVTINAFESSGDFIIVLLDYNGTYFSEYLIIDLYSATGLNEMHANVEGSYLYGGTSFGARIYHVDSTIANPHADEYESFTDNNNSMSSDALLQLIEADGDKNFESDKEYYQGQYYYYASADDLWQTGDVFSDIQPNYTRHDGKQVNFDISFDSVTAESATITITFDNNN
ncbi:MAG: hypothetical protein IJX23_05345 [Clostridia bacterium]|nr:hypothetical protein [Clostridia bacterium]